jgi:hypothetical protein
MGHVFHAHVESLPSNGLSDASRQGVPRP